MNNEKTVKEQEFILDNMIDRDKSKTYYLNDKTGISLENEKLRFSSENFKENKYLEDSKNTENIEKDIKDLVVNNYVIILIDFKFIVLASNRSYQSN